MFCSFDEAPKIIRLHGRGTVVERDDPRFAEIAGRFPPHPGRRAFVIVQVDRIADSCGFGVPIYGFIRERDTLARLEEGRTDDTIAAYRRQKNARSIDGLPGLRTF